MNRRATLLAASGALFCLGMTAMVAAAALASPGRAYAAFGGGTAGDELPSMGVNLATGLLGALIVARRPGNTIGKAMMVIGVAFLSTPVIAVTVAALSMPASVAGWVAWLGNWVWGVGQVGVLVMLFTFPNGRPLSSRWRTIMRAALAGLGLMVLVAMLAPGPLDAAPELRNPVGIDALARVVDPVLFVMAVTLVLAVASLVVRFVRSRGEERLQLRWVAYGAVAYGVSTFVQILPGVPDLGLIDLVGVLILLGAVAVAVTKYRLYEIDRLISRTLTYAVLTALLVGLYLSSVTVLTALTSPVTGESPVAVAAATLLAAATFQPLRRRLQVMVDRRFNRARFDAAREIEAYRGRLRGQLDLASVGEDLTATVRTTLEPAAVALWLPGRERS